MDNIERQEYLREHLFYELLMLRYTLGRIKNNVTQILWNALFESFCLHARNLYGFLRNERDNRNVIASDYIDQFTCGRQNKIAGTMDRLNQQLLHLGKRRYQSGEEKLDTSDAIEIAKWIEEGIKKFSEELRDPYVGHWKQDDADPSNADKTASLAETPSQSNNPTFLLSRTTSAGRTEAIVIDSKEKHPSAE